VIKYLIGKLDIEVATNMTKQDFPILRELSKLIAGGYKFDKSGM